jgi:hypothetical protein
MLAFSPLLIINCAQKRDSVIRIDLAVLPQLSSFELEEYQGGGVIIVGSSETLQRVTLLAVYIDMDFLHQLGPRIQEVDWSFCSLYPAGPQCRTPFPHLTSLTLYDSIQFLPLLFPTNASSLEHVSIDPSSDDQWFHPLFEALHLPTEATVFAARWLSGGTDKPDHSISGKLRVACPHRPGRDPWRSVNVSRM